MPKFEVSYSFVTEATDEAEALAVGLYAEGIEISASARQVGDDFVYVEEDTSEVTDG